MSKSIEKKNEPRQKILNENVDRTAGEWYVLHVMSQREYKVFDAIIAGVLSSQKPLAVYEVALREEKILEFKKKNGEKVKSTRFRNINPGYVYVRLNLYTEEEVIDEETNSTRQSPDTELWSFLRNINGVMGFITGSDSRRPLALSPNEAADLVSALDLAKQDIVITGRAPVDIGETGLINNGPFAGVTGKVIKIDNERGKVTLDVLIFGRSTQVDADFIQVERQQD